MLYFANECLDFISNALKPEVKSFDITTVQVNEDVYMPDDFLSHAGTVNYINDTPNPKIIYLKNNKLRLPEKGSYNIYYNARWEYIKEDNPVDLDIDPSILMCIPTYVASKLLAQDDVQRSTILRNEFELMLSRLDTNITNEATSFHSEGGWY